MIEKKGLTLLLALILLPSAHAISSSNLLYNADGNWDVEGANGRIFVYGSLTESACRLSMNSAFQTVDIGNIESATLKKVGDHGHKTPINIELTDCIETPTLIRNDKTGNAIWSTSQPGFKIHFLSPTVPFKPNLAQVEGVTGIGLLITNQQGKEIEFGENSVPELIFPGNNLLTYYVSPVRTAEAFQAGTYRSIISFQITYE
ncbi:fimbrial protein [Providencia burhodogranariea]|uniref:Fimbrial protein n=1 Tax=Providencia burhodogranariea DSM 19968 TaxID=1141662 RepID=K8VZF0_9GAMM|nr:fimbrial protein [Providencia burhodogranariea]EKT53663.1 fimbrial protein [Providencia burhodogranariea DSM 19968]